MSQTRSNRSENTNALGPFVTHCSREQQDVEPYRFMGEEGKCSKESLQLKLDT